MLDIDKKKWLNAELTEINYFNLEINHDYICTLVCWADVCSAVWGEICSFITFMFENQPLFSAVPPPAIMGLCKQKLLNRSQHLTRTRVGPRTPSFTPGTQIQSRRCFLSNGELQLFIFYQLPNLVFSSQLNFPRHWGWAEWADDRGCEGTDSPLGRWPPEKAQQPGERRAGLWLLATEVAPCQMRHQAMWNQMRWWRLALLVLPRFLVPALLSWICWQGSKARSLWAPSSQ